MKRSKKISTKPIPWGGDHGPSTASAVVNTEIVPVEGDKNHTARRQRINQIAWMGKRKLLTMRQQQASKGIRECDGGGRIQGRNGARG